MCYWQGSKKLVSVLSFATLFRRSHERKWYVDDLSSAIQICWTGDRMQKQKTVENWKIYCLPAVQEERGPRKVKSTNDTLHRPFAVGDDGEPSSCPLDITSKFHYQFLSQILITCIKQAKLNDNFRLFSFAQQKYILSNVWSECFVLRASHWSIDITPIIQQYVPFVRCSFVEWE